MDILKMFNLAPGGRLHDAPFLASIYNAAMNIYTIQLWAHVWQFLLPFFCVIFSNLLYVLAFLLGFLGALMPRQWQAEPTTPKLLAWEARFP